jgi:hypothetical protein
LTKERHCSSDNFLPQHNCNASTTLIVGKILKKLFPKMDISCRIYNGKRGTSYSGVYWKHDASVGGIDMARLAAALPKNTSVTTF